MLQSTTVGPPTNGTVVVPLVYPESDGKPMADNTKQARWIVVLYGNIAALFHLRQDVFVAMDLLWYPEKEDPKLRVAPDVMVAFGRPKGDRDSYKQWEEDGVPFSVVFEILSPGNSLMEMIDKFSFYEEHGVEEYFIFDPDSNSLAVYLRRGDMLRRVLPSHGFVSPRLGIRFDLSGPELVVYRPDNRPFRPFEELEAERQQTLQRAERAEQRAESEKQRADAAEQRGERLADLTRKVLRQEATAEEQQELQRLLAPTSPQAP